jgi:hypothetical protein
MALVQLSTIAEQEAHRNLREENLRCHFRPLGLKEYRVNPRNPWLEFA